MKLIPVYKITISEYKENEKHDWDLVGNKLDQKIKERFLGQNIAIRCISSKEHPRKTIDEVISIIKKTGIDKYDPKRKGKGYENVENKHIDFFALDFHASSESKMMDTFIQSFYEYPIKSGKLPTRINIIIIYDRTKLKRILHKYEGRMDTKKDGFVFKNPLKKKDALLGIIKVL